MADNKKPIDGETPITADITEDELLKFIVESVRRGEHRQDLASKVQKIFDEHKINLRVVEDGGEKRDELQDCKIKAKDIRNVQDYIQVPYDHRILLVSKYRLRADDEVREAGRKIGLNIRDDIYDAIGRVYIGGLSWENTMKLILKLNGTPLTPDMFRRTLKHLKDGEDNEVELYDGASNRILSGETRQIYHEITGKRKPTRAEWLNAKFTKENEFWYINHAKEINRGCGGLDFIQNQLVPCLTIPIFWMDFKDYLDNANSQGLPKENVRTGNQDLHFNSPRKNCVTGFKVDSDGAYLSCDEDPSAVGGLGVRLAYLLDKE